jgi:membrane fusion protein (multidrug efflux system)
LPESEATLIRNSLADKSSALNVKLLLEGGQEHPGSAKLTFVDNEVDPGSGTVRVRAVLPNAEARLIPGQFIRARVEGVSLTNVVSIPRKAMMSGPQGPFVWLVGKDEKVEIRPVKVGRSMGNNVMVTNGLAAGERYIIEGVMKVQPGAPVNAVSVDAAAKQAESEAQSFEEPA